jgi:hypothetical protein
MIQRFAARMLPGRENFWAGKQKSTLNPEYGKRSRISKIAGRHSSRRLQMEIAKTNELSVAAEIVEGVLFCLYPFSGRRSS